MYYVTIGITYQKLVNKEYFQKDKLELTYPLLFREIFKKYIINLNKKILKLERK